MKILNNRKHPNIKQKVTLGANFQEINDEWKITEGKFDHEWLHEVSDTSVKVKVRGLDQQSLPVFLSV